MGRPAGPHCTASFTSSRPHRSRSASWPPRWPCRSPASPPPPRWAGRRRWRSPSPPSASAWWRTGSSGWPASSATPVRSTDLSAIRSARGRGVSVFGRAFLATTGVAAYADWYPLALGAWAVIGVLAARGVRPTTRSVLAFEIVSVCLILVLMSVIYWRLAAGTAPGGQRFSGSVFVLPPGVGLSALALAATSGFLAFAGFESAGSLGEESFAPTRAVPRAIITAVAFGAIFYVACVTAQSLGFGTGAGGVSAFRQSQAPLGDLAKRYVGDPLAALLDLGAVLSALGAGLGGVTVAARMLFSFGRDGIASRRLGGVSPATGVPQRALAVEMLIGLALLTAFRAAGVSALNVFFYLATIGTLSLLVMYVLTNVAAARHLGRRSLWQVVPPAGGVFIAGFVLYHNVWPVPPPPYEYFPYLVLGWLAAGLVVTVAVPGFSRRVDDGLERVAEAEAEAEGAGKAKSAPARGP